MDTADSQHLSRISKMLLAGTGVAFAWVLLSFALGFSASQAHADEDPGLLGAVASTADGTTSTITDVVDGTASAVVQTVAPVVDAVTAAAPAAPVAPVVEVLDVTVAPVLTTVTEVADSGVVAQMVDSALGVVDAVPVVVGTATGNTSSPIVPPVPGLIGFLAGSTGNAAITRMDAVNPLETLARAAYLTGAAAWLSLTSELPAALSPPDSATVSGGELGGALALLRSVLQADSVLSGSAGAGPGAWVLVALGFVIAYRAWMRRTDLENDVAPPAPAYSTDVSPD